MVLGVACSHHGGEGTPSAMPSISTAGATHMLGDNAWAGNRSSMAWTAKRAHRGPRQTSRASLAPPTRQGPGMREHPARDGLSGHAFRAAARCAGGAHPSSACALIALIRLSSSAGTSSCAARTCACCPAAAQATPVRGPASRRPRRRLAPGPAATSMGSGASPREGQALARTHRAHRDELEHGARPTSWRPRPPRLYD